MSSTKTIYTATITLPMYAAWKCPKCNEINFSNGAIICQRQAQSSTSLFSPSPEQAKERAKTLVQQEWADEALRIMLHTAQHTTETHEHLKMGSTTCTKCGKKPAWSIGVGNWTTAMIIATMAGVISAIVAFSIKSSFIPWAIFAVCLGIVAAGIIKGIVYGKMLKKLPKEYAPVFGSINSEIRDYARAHGESLPTPAEAVEIVTNHGERPATTEETSDEPNMSAEQRFCRKCGTALPKDGVCPNCGTQYVEN